MKAFAFAAILSVASLGHSASSYEIPGVKDPRLSNYSIEPLAFNVEGDEAQIDYMLPWELTGIANRIHATGKLVGENTVVLQGPQSDLNCNLTLKKCDVRYHNLVIDLDTLKERLQLQNLNTETVNARLAVARQFSGDPIGVILLFRD